MIKYKTLLAVLFLLWACNDQIKGFDSTYYDLYKESQFANGFALIKDQYGKRLNSYYDEKNYADGIMKASVMFGEMDLLKIKKQVISLMDSSDITNNEEGCWKPLYDEVRKSYGHRYNMIDAWVYWFIFNPQVNYSVVGDSKTGALTDIAIVTAISRADVAYWHRKTVACLKNKMTPQEMQTLHKTWSDKTKECMQEYTGTISNIAAQIYTKLKTLPQYQLNK
ncbi:MAG: hypothetical protein IJ532_05505 [Alphaproteobacteria bacterium]|nr:hypothetical protein [Alphaproteobacteria bacterium]